MSSSDIFEIYRNIAIMVEAVGKNPENLLLQKNLIQQCEVLMAMIMTMREKYQSVEGDPQIR